MKFNKIKLHKIKLKDLHQEIILVNKINSKFLKNLEKKAYH